MNNKRFTLIVAAGAAIAALVAAYLIQSRPKEAAYDRGKIITVAQVGEFFIYLPLYFAIDGKYFEKEGLQVKIVNSGGDDKSVAAVISGAADFGVGDPTFAAIADQQGQQVKVIAAIVNGAPFWGVTNKSQIDLIRSPDQLRGLTVATFPKPSTAYALQAEMFKEGGLEPHIREAQFGSLLPLLNSRDVDIVLELEPNVSIAVANKAHVVYSLSQQYPDFAITGVTVLNKTIAEQPQTVTKFVHAIDAAEKAAHANPAALIAYAKARFPNISSDIAEAAARRMLDSNVLPSTARVSPSGWKAAIDLRIKNGNLKKEPNVYSSLDNQFVP